MGAEQQPGFVDRRSRAPEPEGSGNGGQGWDRAARVRRADAHSRDENGRWHERRGGRSSRERKEIVAVAREQLERRNRARLVDERYVRQGNQWTGNYGNRRWAAARSGARAIVSARPVVRRRRMRGVRIVVGVALARRCLRRGHVRPAVRRATHDPLPPAHEERKPEGQCEGQGPKRQRTMHCESWSLVGPHTGDHSAPSIREIHAGGHE